MIGLLGKVFVYGGGWVRVELVQRLIRLIIQRLLVRQVLSLLRAQISRDLYSLVGGEDRMVIGLPDQLLLVFSFSVVVDWGDLIA